MSLSRCCAAVCFLSSILSASAKIIVVNTTNNVSPGPYETNLVQALNLLQDGDAIRFKIPGTGPFYLITPPIAPDNGYPAITNNNVTIDGYSQPGALPNNDPILSSNNAQIQIVLDSRAGGRHVEDIPGLSLGESEVLLVKGATNVTISGLCFLGPGLGSGTQSDPTTYAVSFEAGADFGRINGCWFGVDLDRQTVYRFQDAVTGFEGPSGVYINGTVIGVEKNAPGAAAARAQFNVIVGEYIPVNLEGQGYRICGNFWNVFPDGLTDYNASGIDPFTLQAFLEIGRSGDNFVLGTDGDGQNDADERNIFGGVTVADDGRLLEWYGGSRTNMVIAGNYFGMAVDGFTRFTNSMKIFGGFNGTTTVRVGSDFDGISDAVEGNLIAMNYPFDTLFSNPGPPGPPIVADLAPGARVSLRGNQLIGNNIPPYSYADDSNDRLAGFTNFFAPYLVANLVIPTLFTNSTQGRLKGRCDLGRPPYTNVIVDIYLADPEGWTNGQKFQLTELSDTDPVTGLTTFRGFAQGRTYLGSFVQSSSQNLNPNPGEFEFDIAGLGLESNAQVTIAVSYTADQPGTHNGRTHTSPFATPIALMPAPIISVKEFGGQIQISWPANQGLFTIQSSTLLVPGSWTNLDPQPPIVQVGPNYQATIPLSATRAFFRLAR